MKQAVAEALVCVEMGNVLIDPCRVREWLSVIGGCSLTQGGCDGL